MRFSMIARLVLISFCWLLPVLSFAQTDAIEGIWNNEEGIARIKIYKAKNDKYYGKIDWLKEPVKDGKTRVDEHNPDKSKKNEPLLGLIILKGFEKDGDNKYDDGTIYDPKNGKTYSCTITRKGNKLDVRGYVGFSWIGRTAVWTKAE